MDQKTIIRLKDNYLFFKDGSSICVYDTEEGLVKLKFTCSEATDLQLIKRELAKPHTLYWLNTQHYWSWLGVLLHRYPQLFEILNERTLLVQRSRADLSEVIARGSYAENAEVTMDFSESTLILYGVSRINLMLAQAVSDMNYKSIIFIDRGEVVEAEDVCDETGIFAYEDLLKSKAELLAEYFGRSRDNIAFIGREELSGLSNVDKSIYIIENKDLSEDELMELNRYITKYRKVALFFQMQPEELVFGPLVVGGESTCLECLKHSGAFDRYFGTKGVPVDSVFKYVLMFFIKRTLCYVKEDDLYILLGDVQIPINKIFRINRLNMGGKFDYIYRDDGCGCAAAV